MSHSAKKTFITELLGQTEDKTDDYSSDLYEEDDEGTRRTSHGGRDSTGQSQYMRACKVCGVVPLSVFKKQLAGNAISLKFQVLNIRNIKACSVGIMFNWSVSKLDIEGSEIGPKGARYLCDVIMKKPQITNLNIASNKLGSEGLRQISNIVKNNDSISKLNISHNDFNENDARYIKDILEGDNQISELKISHNRFCDNGGCLIASGLMNNDTLRVLDLSWNHLRGHGASALGYSLLKNSTLEVLNVSWNGFEIPGCHGLGHGLEQNKSLLELDVGTNRIGLNALCKLLEGIKKNSTLERLNLSDNPLTARGTMLVLQVIERCSVVNHVDFGMYPVEESVIRKIQKIQEQKPLTIYHGKVHYKPTEDDEDETMYINGDPSVILFEYTRIKDVPILDLFIAFDTDGSHALSWDEFKDGVKASKMPVRASDIDKIIRNIDIDLDGEINFTELVIAQKQHNQRVHKLLEKGQRTFDNSNIGRIHQELQKWFHDKGVHINKSTSIMDK